MFSSEHMLAILSNPHYFARFREFLAQERPGSLSTLTHYLNSSKSLKAIHYANALVRSYVDVPTPGIETAEHPVGPIVNTALEQRVQKALDALTAEELPAFITSTYINIAGKLVEERVRGTLPDKFQGTAEALAEVFCLTDPSRPDNPIIFASEGVSQLLRSVDPSLANTPFRIPPQYTVWYGLRPRTKLSVLARSENEPQQCSTYPRSLQSREIPLRAFTELVGSLDSIHYRTNLETQPPRWLTIHEPP